MTGMELLGGLLLSAGLSLPGHAQPAQAAPAADDSRRDGAPVCVALSHAPHAGSVSVDPCCGNTGCSCNGSC